MAVTPSGRERPTIAAEAFLRALADHGADYFFCNTGTDFPPIVEAFSRAKKTNAKVPKPILVPHENLAVAMAHGVYLMNGHPQAVMVHTTAGTANTLNNLLNLARDRVPLILAAGRTPITEKGSFGSRTRPIQWGQEMFDQAGMLREMVKWDYELRVPAQIGDVVARAVEVAMAHPRGPVYLMLPREPLAAPLSSRPGRSSRARKPPAASRPGRARDARRMDRRRRAAAHPRRHAAGRRRAGARRILPSAAPFRSSCSNPRTVCLPSSHRHAFRLRAGRAARRRRSGDRAGKRRALDAAACTHPPAGCRVAHIGEEPFFVRYPMRSFPSDLAVQAGVTQALDGARPRRSSRACRWRRRASPPAARG